MIRNLLELKARLDPRPGPTQRRPRKSATNGFFVLAAKRRKKRRECRTHESLLCHKEHKEHKAARREINPAIGVSRSVDARLGRRLPPWCASTRVGQITTPCAFCAFLRPKRNPRSAPRAQSYVRAERHAPRLRQAFGAARQGAALRYPGSAGIKPTPPRDPALQRRSGGPSPAPPQVARRSVAPYLNHAPCALCVLCALCDQPDPAVRNKKAPGKPGAFAGKRGSDYGSGGGGGGGLSLLAASSRMSPRLVMSVPLLCRLSMS